MAKSSRSGRLGTKAVAVCDRRGPGRLGCSPPAAVSLGSDGTDARPLAVGCGQPLHAYHAAAGRQGRAFGPRLRRAPDGAPVTAVSGLSALTVSYLLQITPDFA
jgi:hypothetical protein